MATDAGGCRLVLGWPSRPAEKPVRPTGGLVPWSEAEKEPARTMKSDYRLERDVLGSGATGEVRLGVCLRSGRTVAVKTFRYKAMSNKALQELKDEIGVHRTLDHPNIARLERIYQESNTSHLVLEHLTGGELFDRVVRLGRVPEKEAANDATQILRAVAYLHSQCVVHRDIKPENLLYASIGGKTLKLIDFGFATRWDGRDKLTKRCGTLQYVAPEVLAADYTNKADVWSIGAVVYTMLTGKSMYSGSDKEVLLKSKAGNPDFSRTFRTVSPDARDFVKSLLEKKPHVRPTAVEALRYPWLRTHANARPAVAKEVLQSLRVCCQEGAWEPPQLSDAVWRWQFEALDADEDGVLTPGDLREALGLGAQEAEQAFAHLAATGGGKLGYHAFLDNVTRRLAASSPDTPGHPDVGLETEASTDAGTSAAASTASMSQAVSFTSGVSSASLNSSGKGRRGIASSFNFRDFLLSLVMAMFPNCTPAP